MATSKPKHFSFWEDDAMKYGVDEAIILYNIRYWVQHNADNKKEFHDGYYWTYNSQEAFHKQFPFWSKYKIQRLLKSLENQEAIKSGNYNKIPYDRTKWYTVIDNYPQGSKMQNCTMDDAEKHNQSSRIAPPIPDINTDINKKERRTNKFDDAQLNLANELLKLIKQNNPNYKEPANIGTWANEIRLMMEQDKRTFKQIDYLIKWSQKNDFWSANCLSARSLRKHFDQMVAQCKREHKRKPIHVVPKPASRDIPSVEETMILIHGPNWREERKKVVGINSRE